MIKFRFSLTYKRCSMASIESPLLCSVRGSQEEPLLFGAGVQEKALRECARKFYHKRARSHASSPPSSHSGSPPPSYRRHLKQALAKTLLLHDYAEEVKEVRGNKTTVELTKELTKEN